jgi:hypothetical protein
MPEKYETLKMEHWCIYISTIFWNCNIFINFNKKIFFEYIWISFLIYFSDFGWAQWIISHSGQGLADRLTLSHPWGVDYAPHITTCMMMTLVSSPKTPPV